MAKQSRRKSFSDIFKSRAAQAGRYLNQARDAIAAMVSDDEDRNRFRRAWNRYQRSPATEEQARKAAASKVFGSKNIPARNLAKNDIGGLYFFVYDAKHKEDLPYWDKYPLIFLFNNNAVINKKLSSKHFMGLNLHYIRPKERALLMDALNDRLLKNGFDPNHKNHDTSLHTKISYQVLRQHAGHRQFSPCVKMYLKNHVRTTLVKVPEDQWEEFIFLPLARFQKKRDSYVWSESARKAR